MKRLITFHFISSLLVGFLETPGHEFIADDFEILRRVENRGDGQVSCLLVMRVYSYINRSMALKYLDTQDFNGSSNITLKRKRKLWRPQWNMQTSSFFQVFDEKLVEIHTLNMKLCKDDSDSNDSIYYEEIDQESENSN
ncbi:hypothetical protein RCL_jg8087.t1 [Rhizophagus clarus]|uniref:Uncharacterized protein n=1 Tax=Rhizophagus clarus TaxID=94130 RepID=A0A8H3R5B7_9GLOM|nr:hypothetical protein RCL_jg8087.t1 [Rhizophagus clarus]